MKVQAFFFVLFVWNACSRGCAAKAIQGRELSVVDQIAPKAKEEVADEENLGKSRVARAVMEIEERSVFDTLQAIARLTGDISRNDVIGAAMDGLIVMQALPLHPVILWIMRRLYQVLSFVHPAFWWLFPSTKPANIRGPGFRKVSFF